MSNVCVCVLRSFVEQDVSHVILQLITKFIIYFMYVTVETHFLVLIQGFTLTITM